MNQLFTSLLLAIWMMVRATGASAQSPENPEPLQPEKRYIQLAWQTDSLTASEGQNVWTYDELHIRMIPDSAYFTISKGTLSRTFPLPENEGDIDFLLFGNPHEKIVFLLQTFEFNSSVDVYGVTWSQILTYNSFSFEGPSENAEQITFEVKKNQLGELEILKKSTERFVLPRTRNE